MRRIFLFLCFPLLGGCFRSEPLPVNELRAPAYPLVTIDPYTSAWSMADKLYDDDVRHWTGKRFPLIGAIRVDGRVYRFMGAEDRFAAIAKTSSEEPWLARYSFTKPPEGWQQPDFDDRAWKEGRGAFGNLYLGDVTTEWVGDNSDIWLRREVTVTDDDLADDQNLFIEYSHDDVFELYLNGKKIVSTDYCWRNNVLLPLRGDTLKMLHPGRNVIAAHCHNTIGGSLLDVGMLKDVPAGIFAQTAVQNSVEVQATQTVYHFTCGPVELELCFTAPLLLNNLELVSRPVNYLSYQIIPTDKKEHQIEMYFEAAPDWALDKAYQESVSETLAKDGFVFLKTGSRSQDILGKSGDNVRIDWGYFYMAAAEENATCATGNEFDMRKSFINNGNLSQTATDGKDNGRLALAQNLGTSDEILTGKVMIGYDDLYSIQYFGTNLRPYWNRDGQSNITKAFVDADSEFDDLIDKCRDFNRQLFNEATLAGGKEYASLCALAYRQAVADHKLVQSPDGELLYFSKECFSNGCIGTVDVTFPSSPLFLLYNPELLKALLNGVFYFSESGKWTHPVAAHDLGTYPLANGQQGAVVQQVEECGNMLIMCAAIAQREASAAYAEKHWESLTTWTNYLLEKGLDPENQLCTDDFTGFLAHNANLSVKAILGIASYGYLSKMLGKPDADTYMQKAKSMAEQWTKRADDGDHYRLAFDKPGTWSQKYNLVWDKMLKFNIFPESVRSKEFTYYLSKQNKYGVPLDCRATFTKSDWLMWTATFAPDKASFEKYIHPLYLFVNETVDRVPMSDWYLTDRPNLQGFRNRSVVGGYFLKMLE